jgi:hypothetical protein
MDDKLIARDVCLVLYDGNKAFSKDGYSEEEEKTRKEEERKKKKNEKKSITVTHMAEERKNTSKLGLSIFTSSRRK